MWPPASEQAVKSDESYGKEQHDVARSVPYVMVECELDVEPSQCHVG